MLPKVAQNCSRTTCSEPEFAHFQLNSWRRKVQCTILSIGRNVRTVILPLLLTSNTIHFVSLGLYSSHSATKVSNINCMWQYSPTIWLHSDWTVSINVLPNPRNQWTNLLLETYIGLLFFSHSGVLLNFSLNSLCHGTSKATVSLCCISHDLIRHGFHVLWVCCLVKQQPV